MDTQKLAEIDQNLDTDTKGINRVYDELMRVHESLGGELSEIFNSTDKQIKLEKFIFGVRWIITKINNVYPELNVEDTTLLLK